MTVGPAQDNTPQLDQREREPVIPVGSTPAERALADLAARRAAALDEVRTGVEELGGRGGLDPVRYGDWEIKGLTSDF